MSVRVQAVMLDPSGEIAAMTAGRDDIGALVTFAGLVRGGDVRAMTLEHYPGMTENALEGIEREASSRWPLKASLIVHRIGRMLPGDMIVLAAAASESRQAAFEAASFMMDQLKTIAPFWKLEERADGSRHWVEARADDDAAAKRWNEQKGA